VRQHATELNTAPNLIIDVRANHGGSDFVWAPVFRLMYTQQVIDVSSSIRSTPDNIAKFEGLLTDSTVPEPDKVEIRDLVAELRAHPGEFIRRHDDTLALPEVLPFPRRVAVMTAAGCKSSCEGFVLTAQQSGKTCLVGEHTGGVLDYANQWHLAVPGSPFVLWYPTSRSQRLPEHPVDPGGIAPDVAVPVDDGQATGRVRELIERGAAWPCHRADRR
jgi:C-terminal processing protease CtpA/Prc